MSTAEKAHPATPENRHPIWALSGLQELEGELLGSITEAVEETADLLVVRARFELSAENVRWLRKDWSRASQWADGELSYDAYKAVVMLDGGVERFIPEPGDVAFHIESSANGTRTVYMLSKPVEGRSTLYFFYVAMRCVPWFRRC
jgi:hypothetical protein